MSLHIDQFAVVRGFAKRFQELLQSSARKLGNKIEISSEIYSESKMEQFEEILERCRDNGNEVSAEAERGLK